MPLLLAREFHPGTQVQAHAGLPGQDHLAFARWRCRHALVSSGRCGCRTAEDLILAFQCLKECRGSGLCLWPKAAQVIDCLDTTPFLGHEGYMNSRQSI